ncbi:Hpt domain-containing protein, partial [Phaeospirillum tilakii]
MSAPLLLRFVAEARDLLQAAAGGLLDLERHPGNDTAINEVFRAVHTLKGSVGLFDFAAFTRMVHVAEDVLSAVRDGQLALTPALVDLLLDALDRMGAWLDDIESAGALPADADHVAHATTTALRAALPAAAETETAAAPAAAAATDLGWVAALPEPDRHAAVARALAGAPLTALEYRPVEDCFFSGEDPVNLFRQLPELIALAIEAPEGWPPADQFDPYACRLRLRALVAAPPEQVETLFRYVLDQVALAPVAPETLIVPAGAAGDDGEAGPVREDFLAAARPLLAAADWDGLRRIVTALRELTGGHLLIASALRWLDLVLAAPAPVPGWIAALIETIATGAAVAPAGAGPAGVLPPLARALLEGQRFGLGLPGAETQPGRIAAIGRGVGAILRALGQDDTAWRDDVAAASAGDDPTPMLAALDRLLAADDAAAAAAAPAEPPHRATGPPP